MTSRNEGTLSNGPPSTNDAWSEFTAFSAKQPPDPGNILASLEWKFQGQYWDLFFSGHSEAVKAQPRLFWERIKSCGQIRKLCDGGSRKQDVYAVLELLQDLHRRENGLGRAWNQGSEAQQPTRKQQRREWEKVQRALQRALSAIENIPESKWDLLGEPAKQAKVLRPIQSRLSAAKRYASNPPGLGGGGITIKLGVKTVEVGSGTNLSPDPPKKGQFREQHTRSPQFQSHLKTALLYEFLQRLYTQPGPVLFTLLRHFNPKQFQHNGADPGNVEEARQVYEKKLLPCIRKFKKRYGMVFERELKYYEDLPQRRCADS